MLTRFDPPDAWPCLGWGHLRLHLKPKGAQNGPTVVKNDVTPKIFCWGSSNTCFEHAWGPCRLDAGTPIRSCMHIREKAVGRRIAAPLSPWLSQTSKQQAASNICSSYPFHPPCPTEACGAQTWVFRTPGWWLPPKTHFVVWSAVGKPCNGHNFQGPRQCWARVVVGMGTWEGHHAKHPLKPAFQLHPLRPISKRPRMNCSPPLIWAILSREGLGDIRVSRGTCSYRGSVIPATTSQPLTGPV